MAAAANGKERAQITGEPREKLAAELKARYDDGAKIRNLAREFGLSYGFTHTLLTEAGTVMRNSGPRAAGTKVRRESRRPRTEQERREVGQELKAKYEAGTSEGQLATEKGWSCDYVIKLLWQSGAVKRSETGIESA